jgi:hypothetical protein
LGQIRGVASPEFIQCAGNGFAPIAIVSADLLQVVGDVRGHPLNGAKARQARQYRQSIRGRMH